MIRHSWTPRCGLWGSLFTSRRTKAASRNRSVTKPTEPTFRLQKEQGNPVPGQSHCSIFHFSVHSWNGLPWDHHPLLTEICGRWQLSNGESFVIRDLAKSMKLEGG